jgi:hypothetical protein
LYSYRIISSNLSSCAKATEQELKRKIQKFEEENQMPYITSVERIARQEGILQQGREDVIEVLEVRFGEVPTEISQKINSREDPEVLKTLHREAIAIESMEQFGGYVEQIG